VYVFPAKNQTPEQTQKDESYCYDWAVQNSGIDPLNMQAVKPDSVKTGPNGAMVAGAAKGAAAGVAIGAIAGDAGEGAAIGAVAGGLAGRRARKQNEKAQKQQAQQNAELATQAQVDNFTKAYKACLTGKGYTVE
jgi:outer membrane lipoprotein SlyB